MSERLSGSKQFRVSNEETAAYVGSGSLAVLATPVIVKMVEHYCFTELERTLDKNLTSVGVLIELEHIKPTLVGDVVKIDYHMEQVDPRRYVFSFEAHDTKQKIATGKHERVVVDSEKFMQKARQKNES